MTTTQTPARVSVNYRLDRELDDYIRESAARERRSLNAQINQLLTEAIERRERLEELEQTNRRD